MLVWVSSACLGSKYWYGGFKGDQEWTPIFHTILFTRTLKTGRPASYGNFHM